LLERRIVKLARMATFTADGECRVPIRAAFVLGAKRESAQALDLMDGALLNESVQRRVDLKRRSKTLPAELMMLPAAAARFWTTRVESMCLLAVAIGIASCISGLLLSYHASLPSGPAIILSAGVLYVFSIVAGKRGALATRVQHAVHRTA
jgi:hypothetical protein